MLLSFVLIFQVNATGLDAKTNKLEYTCYPKLSGNLKDHQDN